MKLSHTIAAFGATALLTGAGPQVFAGDGHDHGDAPAPMSGPALPRFSAVSELFELVGVVDGKEITLFLDRFADNSPVKDAKLELQFDGTTIPVESHAEGEFEATLPRALEPGVVSVTATVFAGGETDLLGGELHLHDESAAHEEPEVGTWRRYAPWLGAGIVALGLVGWKLQRKGNGGHPSSGGAA